MDLEADHRLPRLEQLRDRVGSRRRLLGRALAEADGALDHRAGAEQRRLVERLAEQLRADRQALAVSPHGTLMPGSPARLHDSVKMSPRYMSSGVAFAPNANAAVGVVGVRMTSTVLERLVEVALDQRAHLLRLLVVRVVVAASAARTCRA